MIQGGLKMFIRTITLFGLIFLTYANSAEATSTPIQDSVVIDTYMIDITGDGSKETIQLEGKMLSSNSTYFPFVVANIQSQTGESWSIELPGGFEPSLQFTDLTNNDTNELLYKGSVSPTKHSYTYKVHTFENEEFTSIPIPEDSFVHGKFQENFIAHIYITPHEDPIIVDLKDKANDYIHSGVYHKNGTLLKQQDIMIEPIHSITPIDTEESSTIIETLQRVSSMIDSSELGLIESRWTYENHSWKLIDSSWKQ